MSEITLSIIKPDAVRNGYTGKILAQIQAADLKIVGLRMLHLSRKEAEGFYAVHKERPFYQELVEFMISGPVVVSALEGEKAIERYRKLMGATDPAKADEGTLRKLFAESLQNNAVHGSDAPETAQVEVAYFFSSVDLVS